MVGTKEEDDAVHDLTLQQHVACCRRQLQFNGQVDEVKGSSGFD